jgi:hypothetical protein
MSGEGKRGGRGWVGGKEKEKVREAEKERWYRAAATMFLAIEHLYIIKIIEDSNSFCVLGLHCL